jgi:acyl-CoA thioesterase FadM
MDVSYLLPTPTGKTLRVVGWTLEMNEERARVAAEIRLPDGTVTARCEALLLKLSQAFLDQVDAAGEKAVWRYFES